MGLIIWLVKVLVGVSTSIRGEEGPLLRFASLLHVELLYRDGVHIGLGVLPLGEAPPAISCHHLRVGASEWN